MIIRKKQNYFLVLFLKYLINKNTINKLIVLRLLKKNNFNIKTLFLKNLNHKDIINLNKKQLNYSIFDKKDTFTLLLKKKRLMFINPHI